MSGLLNDYMYVEKVYEKYTMHTRIVTHTDGKGHTYTTVQTYYTWDYHGHDVTKASTVNFLGIDFPIEKFALDWHTTLNLNTETTDNTILNISQGNYCYPDGFWESVGDIRYHYNVIPKTSTGSILVRLADEDITPVFSKKIELIKKTPAEIVEDKQDSENIPVIIFWVLWSIGIIMQPERMIGWKFVRIVDDKKRRMLNRILLFIFLLTFLFFYYIIYYNQKERRC